MVLWKTVEQSGKFNTGIAATATEEIVANPTTNPFFNWLFVQNFDAVDCEILLDSGDNRTVAANQGKIYRIGANGSLLIEPEDGIKFKQIVQRNAHASTAQTANTIIFQYAYKVRIG